jgi:hypothetical protein
MQRVHSCDRPAVPDVTKTVSDTPTAYAKHQGV